MEKIQTIMADLSEIPCQFGSRPHAERVETGALKINDDWPGVFIRGDNALAYAMYLYQAIDILERTLKEKGDDSNIDVFALHGLKGLYELMASCRA